MNNNYLTILLALFVNSYYCQSLSDNYDLDTSNYPHIRTLIKWDTKTISLDPDNPKGYFTRAVDYAKIHDFQKALNDLTIADSLLPNEAAIIYKRGSVKHRLGDLKGALTDFTRVTELKPDFEWGFLDKGIILNELEKYDQAIEAFHKALEIKPDWAEPYHQIGKTYEDRKEYDKAMENYNIAINMDKSVAMVFNNRGNLKKLTGNYEEAINDFAQAITLKPDYRLAYLNIAQCYLVLEKNDNVLIFINKAIEISPIYYDAIEFRKNFFKRIGDHQKACLDLAKMKELDPKIEDTGLKCN